MCEVHIRRARAEDAEVVHAIRSDPLVRRHQPLVQRPLDMLRVSLAERGAMPLDTSHADTVQWTILVDGETAGWVTLDVSSREHDIGDIGYAVAPRYHGRGIATHAVRAMIPIAFDPHGLALERLQAVAAVDNIASRRVLEKAGFSQEGIARGYLRIAGCRVDHATYGLLRTDQPRDHWS